MTIILYVVCGIVIGIGGCVLLLREEINGSINKFFSKTNKTNNTKSD